VQRDSEAFDRVMQAFKRPRAERGPYVEEAMHGAAEVPMQVLERTVAMLARMEALQIPPRYGSDLAVAKALSEAAKTGALANVRENLHSIASAEFITGIRQRLAEVGLSAE
jgi:formiminotetrahydrofolate cyclodeaminase